jgi:hypothetical protein
MAKHSTNIINKSSVLQGALHNINSKFRSRIIQTYLELKQRMAKSFYSNEFDSSGVSSGKFCETVFRFLEFELKQGVFIPFGKAIPNLTAELTKIEQLPKVNGHDSLRLIIPRAIAFVYTLRNKRGIGHVGGDVEANAIDSATIVKGADWILAELIRIYHSLSLEEAQSLINSINTRSIPDVWEINGKKRILKKGLDFKSKVLLLAYTDLENGVAVEDLFDWAGHSNLSMFKSSVLKALHKESLIEYDLVLEYVHISPLGIKNVEEEVLNG